MGIPNASRVSKERDGRLFAASRLKAPDADFEPVKAFDNLYYVGLTEIGAWAVQTSAGI